MVSKANSPKGAPLSRASTSPGKIKLKLPDIKPTTTIAALRPERYDGVAASFPIRQVSIAAGMSPTFIRKVCGRKDSLSIPDVLLLLEQDSYRETLVPRSKAIDYLLAQLDRPVRAQSIPRVSGCQLLQGHVLERLLEMHPQSVQCVITSTPYWGLRIYDDPLVVSWADGEHCPFGHEQTPDGFLRHTTEVLAALYDVLTPDGSIWWNVMDSFNTRTQIRGNAVEALRAMQGKDGRSWGDHECRRYSAGHSFLKDGEQCLIPILIAERASRIGFYVKSVITWAKTSTLPEPQESRVSRNLEYVLHLTKQRTPLFNKDAYRQLPPELGGRNNGRETDKLSDVWSLPTSNGRDGHGAQFPVALPARCIALSTRAHDVVLDPFVGAGNSGVAARLLGRSFVGIDVCSEYLKTAEKRIAAAETRPIVGATKRIVQPPLPGTLL